MRSFFARVGFDGLLSLVFVAGAILAFVASFDFPPSAGIWPRWVIGTFGVLSSVVALGKVLLPPHPPVRDRR